MNGGFFPLPALVVAASLLAFAPSLDAQSIYVDTGSFGDPLPPSNAFAAAADQPGTWNRVGTPPAALVDVNGAATGVTLTATPATSFSGVADDPGTSGDVERLMDDHGSTPAGIGETETLTLSGLEPGAYKVYTYAWRSVFTTNSTASVDVNAVGPQIVQPVLETFAGFSLGENYSVHDVVIGSGDELNIVITALDDVFDQAFYAGFQVVQGQIFADDFEQGDTTAWSSQIP